MTPITSNTTTIYLDRGNKPDSLFEHWVYPDGVSTQVRLTGEGIRQVSHASDVQIVANLRTPADIITLVHLLDAVRSVYRKIIRLVLPYLPYSRADRRFGVGDTFGLETFLTFFQRFHPVETVTFDVHSDASKSIDSRVKSVDSWMQVLQTIAEVQNSNGTNKLNVLLPDEGAIGRYPKLKGTDKDDYVRTLHASKVRDPQTGVLSGFSVPSKDRFLDAPVLIVDDLCDGGGTFLGIASELRKAGITQPLYLYVSHGIFSKGLDALFKQFDRIFTTNTLDIASNEPRLKIYDVIPQLLLK